MIFEHRAGWILGSDSNLTKKYEQQKILGSLFQNAV